MKRHTKIIGILSINLLLFFLTFFLVEGIFRVVGIPYKIKYIPNENSFARFDDELGWSYVPNTSAMHKVGDSKIPVHFDKNGFRIPEPGLSFDSDLPTILFIGGSFTMGHGVTYEESFVGRVDALAEIPYQVVNLGVQGYGTDQALLSLKKFLPKFNTKIVVYTFIEDHIRRNGNYDRRMLIPTARFLGTKPLFALNGDKRPYLAEKPLLFEDYIHSYLVDFLRIKIGTLVGAFPPYPENLTKELIREMNTFSLEHNARFVVLNWRWSENDYSRLFRDLDVDVIDTLTDAPEGWGEMVLLGGIHPNPQASDHAARLLLNYFKSHGLIQ